MPHQAPLSSVAHVAVEVMDENIEAIDTITNQDDEALENGLSIASYTELTPVPPQSIAPSTSSNFNFTGSLSAITDSQFEYALTNCTPGLLPRFKKRKFTDQAEKLSLGWLKKMFETLTSDIHPTLQLLNWKIRNYNGKETLCLTLSDGENATKQVSVTDNLEERIREISLYTLIQINTGTVLDGCLLQVEDFKILAHAAEPIINGKQLTNLDKNFFENIFKSKNMLNVEGSKNLEHPHFKSTPFFKRLRSRLTSLPGGGRKCPSCDRIFKTDLTLKKHKCN